METTSHRTLLKHKSSAETDLAAAASGQEARQLSNNLRHNAIPLLCKTNVLDASSDQSRRVRKFPPPAFKQSKGSEPLLSGACTLDDDHGKCNPFVANMFIHPSSTSCQRSQPRRFCRVLLDTGADFNLISHRTYSQLESSQRKCSNTLRSLAGKTKLEIQTLLRWHCRPHSSSMSRKPPTHEAWFFVLPPDDDSMFDVLLGRFWIMENWAEFVSLVEVNSREGLLARHTTNACAL